MKKRKKTKVVYKEDTGETIYSMAALYGRTPEQQEEFDRKRKSIPPFNAKERSAMLKAAFAVYGPVLLCVVGSFFVAAVLLYLFLI